MMTGLRLLLIEDDAQCAAQVREDLTKAGHAVTHFGDCASGFAAARAGDYDAMILDRSLPDGDGVQMLGASRAQGMDLPALILTASAGLHQRVEGLDAGGDDYLVKPFESIELEARLRAIVRRARQDVAVGSHLSCGTIEIDRLRREVRRAGQRVVLQPREHRLLEELALQHGNVVTRTMLLQSVWNLQFDPRTKLIESHMSRLRDKLNAGFAVDAIETVRGVGYRLRVDA